MHCRNVFLNAGNKQRKKKRRTLHANANRHHFCHFFSRQSRGRNKRGCIYCYRQLLIGSPACIEAFAVCTPKNGCEKHKQRLQLQNVYIECHAFYCTKLHKMFVWSTTASNQGLYKYLLNTFIRLICSLAEQRAPITTLHTVRCFSPIVRSPF